MSERETRHVKASVRETTRMQPVPIELDHSGDANEMVYAPTDPQWKHPSDSHGAMGATPSGEAETEEMVKLAEEWLRWRADGSPPGFAPHFDQTGFSRALVALRARVRELREKLDGTVENLHLSRLQYERYRELVKNNAQKKLFDAELAAATARAERAERALLALLNVLPFPVGHYFGGEPNEMMEGIRIMLQKNPFLAKERSMMNSAEEALLGVLRRKYSDYVFRGPISPR